MSQSFSRQRPRLSGAILVMMGSGLLYWMAWLPVRDAWAGELSVHLVAKGVVVGSTCLTAGLLLLVFGPLIAPILNPGPDEPKFVVYALSALIVTAGFAAYLALKMYLSSFGYLFP